MSPQHTTCTVSYLVILYYFYFYFILFFIFLYFSAVCTEINGIGIFLIRKYIFGIRTSRFRIIHQIVMMFSS